MSEHGLGGDGSFDTRDRRVLIRSFYTAPFVAPIPPPRAVSPVSHSIPLSMVETPELERLVPSNSLDLTGRYHPGLSSCIYHTTAGLRYSLPKVRAARIDYPMYYYRASGPATTPNFLRFHHVAGLHPSNIPIQPSRPRAEIKTRLAQTCRSQAMAYKATSFHPPCSKTPYSPTTFARCSSRSSRPLGTRE